MNVNKSSVKPVRYTGMYKDMNGLVFPKFVSLFGSPCDKVHCTPY